MPSNPQDYIGDWESAVEEAAGITSGLLKDVGKNVINRPYGSEPVSMENRLIEWSLMRESPEALSMYFDDQGMSDESAIRHSIEMERAFKKWSQKGG